MTNPLREQLEKKRDELALSHKHELEKSNASFRAGADAMLDLLMPCLEALELAHEIITLTHPDLSNIEMNTITTRQYVAWTRDARSDAIEKLRERLK